MDNQNQPNANVFDVLAQASPPPYLSKSTASIIESAQRAEAANARTRAVIEDTARINRQTKKILTVALALSLVALAASAWTLWRVLAQ